MGSGGRLGGPIGLARVTRAAGHEFGIFAVTNFIVEDGVGYWAILNCNESEMKSINATTI